MKFLSIARRYRTSGTKDIVAAVIAGYEFDRIKYWVNSLDRTEFAGLKLIMCADVEEACVRELERRDYTVLKFKRLESPDEPNSIFKERFFQIWKALNSLNMRWQYRFVIFPDVKDLIFQYNPSEWLQNNMGRYALNVGSECIKHKHEKWAKKILFRDYGMEIYEKMEDKVVYNAGTMAGTVDAFSDFCLNIYLSCRNNSDQAAANILIGLSGYKELTKLSSAGCAWACQAGTTADPGVIDSYRPFLTEPEPTFDGSLVRTSTGATFCLVHQYDRVPYWSERLREIYASSK